MLTQRSTPDFWLLAMTTQLQRPILIGGALLALALWMLDILEHALGEWSVYALIAGTVGAGAWWLRQKPASPAAFQMPQRVDSAIVQKTLSEAEQVLTQLKAEVAEPEAPRTIAEPELSRLQSQVAQIATGMQRQDLWLSVVGSKGSGKSTLIQLLQSGWATSTAKTLHLRETPSFSGITAAGLNAEAAALQQALGADLVLYLITGDLTESELQTLKHLAARKRALLVLNKQDQYLPAERQTILARVQERVQGVLAAGDVVAIAANPMPLKVRQHQADGSVKEWLEDRAPELAVLTQRLDQILAQESQQLILASSFSNALDLKTQVKTILNDVRRARALPVVEQFQWIAAATAFASPMPTVDLVATAAISVQMVLDLGAIYRQKFSLQQAQKIATTLGSLMLKMGLVELSTQAIASFLKTNAITYVAGGCVQGLSAAYLTRVAGLSLIEYFHTQEPNLTLTEASPLPIERFSQIVQSVFQQNQQVAFLRTFIMQAIDRFVPQARPQLLTLSTPSTAAPVNSVGEVLQIPLSLKQEVKILEQNESSVPLSVSSLDSTSVSSP